jgi:hypothetical protein
MINYFRQSSDLTRLQIAINYLLSFLLGAVVMYTVILLVTLPGIERDVQQQREYYERRYNEQTQEYRLRAQEWTERELSLIKEIHRAQRDAR